MNRIVVLAAMLLCLISCGGSGGGSNSADGSSVDRSKVSEITETLNQPGSDDSLDGSWLYVGESSETSSQDVDSGMYSGVWFESYNIIDNGDTVDITGCNGYVGPKLYLESGGNVTLSWGAEEYEGVNRNNALLEFDTKEFDVVEDGVQYFVQSTFSLVKLSNIISDSIGILKVDDATIEISCIWYANMSEIDSNGDRQPWYQAVFKSVEGEYFYFLTEDIFTMNFSGKVISITFEDGGEGSFSFY